jgi:hypothetical protein
MEFQKALNRAFIYLPTNHNQMKKITLVSALFTLVISTYAQSQNNTCNFQWGTLQEVLNHSWGNVYIRIQSSACLNGSICGWPKIALEHSFPGNANLTVYLKGIDCSGNAISSGFYATDLKPEFELQDPGNWHTFKQVTGIASVEVDFQKDNDRYKIFVDKDKNITRIFKNGVITNSTDPMDKSNTNNSGPSNNGAITSNQSGAGASASTFHTSNGNGNNGIAYQTQPGSRYYEDSITLKHYQDSMELVRENRDARVAAVNQIHNDNVDAMNNAALQVTSLMMSNKNNDKSLKKTSFKLEGALVYTQVPAITNTTSADGSINNYSTYDYLSFPGATVGLQFWYTPIRFISLRLKPALTYGLSTASGTTGGYLDYSGDIKLMFGSKIKLFGEGAYISKTGSYSYDGDAANADLGLYTTSGIITTGEFNYTILRYGGGIYFETSKESDSYIELSAFEDKTSIINNRTSDNNYSSAPPLIYKASFVFGKFLLEGLYSPNYPLDGSMSYPIDSQGFKKQPYIEIKLGAVISL